MKCLEIAIFKDFAPNTPGLLGVAQGPQTPCREVRDSRCVSTNPPLEIPAYEPATVNLWYWFKPELHGLTVCDFLQYVSFSRWRSKVEIDRYRTKDSLVFIWICVRFMVSFCWICKTNVIFVLQSFCLPRIHRSTTETVIVCSIITLHAVALWLFPFSYAPIWARPIFIWRV